MVSVTSSRHAIARIAAWLLLPFLIPLLAGCRRSMYRQTGLAVQVPRGWQAKEALSQDDSQNSPIVMVSRDSNHMLMLWTRTNEESPGNARDSRRLGCFAGRYAALGNTSLHRWSVAQPLQVEDVLIIRPPRDANQVYIVSARSPVEESCIVLFSYRSPIPTENARKLSQEVLCSLSLSDGAKPFKRMGKKAVGTTSLKSPVSARTLSIEGDSIVLPNGWVPEDLLLIGSPGGNYCKSSHHATVSLAFTHQEAKRVGSITLKWAHEGRPEQDVRELTASLTRLLAKVLSIPGMRRTEIMHVRSPRESIWRLQRFEGAASRPLVQWVCVTDTLAFQATAISDDESSLAIQQRAVLDIVEQLLKQ